MFSCNAEQPRRRERDRGTSENRLPDTESSRALEENSSAVRPSLAVSLVCVMFPPHQTEVTLPVFLCRDGAENMYYFSSLALTLNEPEEGVAPTDSRRRPDQRLMEQGLWDEANAEKQRLEEKQRTVRREREREAAQIANTEDSEGETRGGRSETRREKGCGLVLRHGGWRMGG